MSYVPIGWNELPSSDFNATPLSAENLNHMDQGIKRTHAQAMTTAERNALSGADLFTGRIIFNTTFERFQIYIASIPSSPTALTGPGWMTLPIFFDLPSATPAFIGTRRYLTTDFNLNFGFTIIPWLGIDRTDGVFSAGGGGTTISPQAEGIYVVSSQVTFSRISGGPFVTELRKNTEVMIDNRGPMIDSHSTHDSEPHSQNFQTTVHLTASDTVSVATRRAIQASVPQVLSGRTRTFLDIYRIG